jgi:hypothetical protein
MPLKEDIAAHMALDVLPSFGQKRVLDDFVRDFRTALISVAVTGRIDVRTEVA